MRSRHPWPVTPLARSVGIAFALAAPLAAWSQAALVHPMGRAMIVTPDSAAGRVVRTVFQRTYDRVRIEQSEPGAPAAYAHPVASVGTEQLRAALAALRRTDSRNAELFNDDELASIVPPLVQALAEVTPQQEVTFAVAGRHGALGPLVERSVTTGRMFHSADGLELIVGLAHRPFEGQFLATGLLIAFEPGGRAAPVDPNLRLAPQGTLGQRRSDWVTLAVGPAAMAAPPAVPAPAAAAPAAPAAAPAAPAAVAAPLAPAAPPAAAQAQPGTRTPAFLAEQEERLKTLKRLRDQSLITEDEYQQKRREILQLL